MAGWNRNDEIIREREVYVDDQCCENCRYWCGWDPVESVPVLERREINEGVSS